MAFDFVPACINTVLIIGMVRIFYYNNYSLYICLNNDSNYSVYISLYNDSNPQFQPPLGLRMHFFRKGQYLLNFSVSGF